MGVSVTALAKSIAAATDASAAAVGITGKPGQGPIVVYIAGSGRSGSTLLERALGEIPGFVNVGELIDLYRQVAARFRDIGASIVMPLVGRYATSMEMTGVSFTLCKLDEELEKLLKAPADCAFWRV